MAKTTAQYSDGGWDFKDMLVVQLSIHMKKNTYLEPCFTT